MISDSSGALRSGGRMVYAADIRSTRCKASGIPNFGWVKVDPADPATLRGSSDIGKLAEQIIADLQGGRNVALGFEAPLFIPVPAPSSALCYGRENDGNRSCMAPAGLTVTALGLHKSAWILARIGECCGSSIQFSMDPRSWQFSRRPVLFCWEAFVSGNAHGDNHLQDAATAAIAFVAAESDLKGATRVRAERPLSVIAAAALWSGLTSEVALMHEATIVISPEEPFRADIPEA
jgi:hypothetical protein